MKLPCFLLLLCTLSAAALDGIDFRPDGSLSAGTVDGRLVCFDRQWRVRRQSADTLSARFDGKRLAASWQATGTGVITLLQEVSETDGKLRCDFKLAAAEPIPSRLLCYLFTLPDSMTGSTVFINSRPVPLSDKAQGVLFSGKAKSIGFETGGKLLVITGDFSVELRAWRKNDQGNYQLRLRFIPENSAIRQASLQFTLAYPGVLPPQRGGFTWPDDAEYRPLPQYDSLAVKPGSALDFSFLQDAPAGKYGRVVVRDGHFEFQQRPGEPVRFYGVNLCSDAQYLSRSECERLAAELARIGYNAVRLHHYDAMLVKDMPDSTTLNADNLDRLDYLVHCLKQKGMYITTDFYCNRVNLPGEIPELAGSSNRRPLKKAVLLYQSARDNWKAFVRNLLTHVNPYTGIRWADEPALAFAALLNEDPAFYAWERDPVMKADFERAFGKWSKRKKLTFKDDASRRHAMAQFLIERQIEVYREFRRFIREELGSSLPLSGINFKNAEAQSFIRETLDYVDNHSYYNHPAFPEGKAYYPPVKFTPRNPVAGGAPAMRDLAHSRIYGKPFTITETNYVAPNPFRAAGGALLGSFGNLQDYDAIFRFAYSHRAKDLFRYRTMHYFDIVSDPANLLSERIGAMLFLRRDVRPFRKRRVWLYDSSAYRAFHDFGNEGGRFPFQFGRLALSGRLGVLNRTEFARTDKTDSEFFISRRTNKPAGAEYWEGRLPDEQQGLVSDTGEFTLRPDRQQLKVVTPRSEIAILPAETEIACDFMAVRNIRGYGVFFLTALDGRPLRESGRLLLLHLTDVQSSDIRFDDRECTLLRSWGKLPLRLKHGIAEVTLKLPAAATIQALSATGETVGELQPTPLPGGKAVLHLDNFFKGGVMAYELLIR